ncbi:hypothetical protein AVEN_240379-1 [Araneus ventricosus]|uniref:Endonuclease/exonuclease/phosphatase domain-containing protein n=1 Tax=Araneus ventricosus TaxID=182803 RepID=A0A4Y2F0X9_ARAVE|nr:hypothetical protein AVEN_240379-1 [Araneus ventricosus]
MNSRRFPSPRKLLWELRFTTQTPSLTLARPKIRLARIEPTKPAGAGVVRTNSYTKAVKSSGFQTTQTDERITKVFVPPLVKLKPVTVRSLQAQKASSAEKSNVSLPKDKLYTRMKKVPNPKNGGRCCCTDHLHSLITVCNLYIPPNQHVAQSELNNLINQLPTPFVFIGDLNGHCPIWGSPDTNSRRLQIEQLITDFNLCLLNSDQETYFHQPTGTFHSIDLAICSPFIFPFFDLTIDNSDHFPLILNDNRYHTTISWQPPKYAFAKVDWTNFALFATITSYMVQNIPIDEAIQNVTKLINDAAETSIPKQNTSRKKQSKPWWNQDCQQASKRQKKKDWNIFRRYPTVTNLIVFKKARAESRRIQRRSRRISWINYISSISSTISSRELWQKVKKASCASFSKGICTTC